MPRPWPLDSASPTVWCANTSFGRCSAVVNTWIASAMIDSRSHRSTDIERDPTHLAAAEWFVRLHGSEVSIEETLAWQAWLRESPDNARAFARLEELSDVLRSLSLPGRISARELASDGYDASIPLKEWQPTRRRFRRGMTVALAALVAGMAFAFMLAVRNTAAPNTFSTRVGENRVLSLSDGSTIALGGNTRI